MAVSRRKKMIRENKLRIYSTELKRAKKFTSSSPTIQEFKEYVPSRSYVRVPESIPSFNAFTTNANATAKAAAKEYSGDYITGLATMHKSNIVPVGRDDDPKNYATMRRN
jgi:hypothetical protein